MGRNKTRKGTRYRDATNEELQADLNYFTAAHARGVEMMNEYQWALDDPDRIGSEPEEARQAWNRASKHAEELGSFVTALRMYLHIR